MIRLEQQVRPHPDVVDTDLDGKEVVLLHLDSKTYFSLNLTGTRIWQGLKQGHTLQEISRQLQEAFEVNAERADRSVLTLVRELAQHQLVQVVD
jgi:hypothetical protein